MISWLRRKRHETLAALVLLLRRGEPLPAGLRDLGRDDPDMDRTWAGLVSRLERGESLDQALIGERFLSRAEAATLGQDPAMALERLTRRVHADQAGASLLRWYPLWIAAWWMIPGLVLSAVVEAVSRHPFPLLWQASQTGQAWLTPSLAMLAAEVLGFWLITSLLISRGWLQALSFLLMPGARRALLARHLLDQAQAGTTTSLWWWERRLWHLSGLQRPAPATDPHAALIADRLLALDAAGRIDWQRSHQQADEEVRCRLAPARALLNFGLVLAAIGGFADFLKLHPILDLFDVPPLYLAERTIYATAGLIGGLVLAQAVHALGRKFLHGWRWNSAWPRMADLLATALERREDPLVAVGSCRPLLPFSLRARLDTACLELSAGDSGSLMTILGRAGLINPQQRRAALAAEQAGTESLIAWLHQEGAAAPSGGAAYAQMHLQLLGCLFITTYLTAFVMPKFVQMLRSLNMTDDAPWSLSLAIAIGSSWWPWLILGSLIAAGVISHRQGWWPGQRERLRLQRGDLMVRALASGRTEAEVAGILAWTWRTPPRGRAAAGQQGDWGRLFACAGWPARTPATLAEAVDRDRLRLGRSRARAIAISLVLVPFLTALPVGLTMHSVFASIAALQHQMLVVAQRNQGGTGRYLGAAIGGPDPVMIVPFLRDPLPLGARPAGAPP